MENVCSNTSHPNRAGRDKVYMLAPAGGWDEVHHYIIWPLVVVDCKMENYTLPLAFQCWWRLSDGISEGVHKTLFK